MRTASCCSEVPGCEYPNFCLSSIQIAEFPRLRIPTSLSGGCALALASTLRSAAAHRFARRSEQLNAYPLNPFERGACVGSPMRNMADNNKLIKGAPDVGGAGR